uniref:Uncharacterized protein n=1 Tax=Plectus sambesii TaxID=2011161 RepID=A0A914X404_9BILA
MFKISFNHLSDHDIACGIRLKWSKPSPNSLKDAGSIPAESDFHPTKVLIPLWVGELVAAKLRIYRRQALATGRPILTSRINHGPKSHRDNGPEERTPPLCGTTA